MPVFSHPQMKPLDANFRRYNCDPRWRWFWEMALFAEPFIHPHWVGYDYANDHRANLIESGHANKNGIRGHRIQKAAAIATERDWDYNAFTGTAANKRPRWLNFSDISFFCVIEPTILTTNDVLMAVEGGSTDTAARNSIMYLEIQSSGNIIWIHENGSGVNNTVTGTSLLTANVRDSVGAVRDATAKSVTWYKNGALNNSGNYTNNADSTTGASIGIGDRVDSDAGESGDFYMECMYYFKGKLTGAMMRQLHYDPWGAFRQPQRRGTAGGGSPVSGVRSFVAGMLG